MVAHWIRNYAVPGSNSIVDTRVTANSREQGIYTLLLEVDSVRGSAKMRRIFALRQQLTRSLGSLVPSQVTRGVCWCQAEGYGNGRSAPNPMGYGEPKGRRC